MELTWFWPTLKEETSPKSNSKNASWYLFTNMGIRVLLRTFPPRQLRIVSHARLLLSMINCSKRNFVVFRTSNENWGNRLPGLLGRSYPHVESLTELCDVRRGLEDTAISFGRERKVLNMCSQSSMNSFFTASFLVSADFFLALFVNKLACLNNFCDLRKDEFHEFHEFIPREFSFEKFPKSVFPLAGA